MKKLFFWLGLPLRIIIIVIIYPVVVLMIPSEIDEHNKFMKEIFWGRS